VSFYWDEGERKGAPSTIIAITEEGDEISIR
jgi:hypothetical protein